MRSRTNAVVSVELFFRTTGITYGLHSRYAILVKEPMGNMACSCHLIDEVNYYTSAHDPAMGPGKIINEQLVHRQEITTKSGNRRVTLTFMPCKNCGECPASIRQITHHVSNLDGDKENTMYIREETVELNSEHFRETGEDPEELLIEDLKRKVNTFIGHWNSIVF